ncbi:MAG: hypothetical protein KIS67_04555 [Verrucomicrobiae bacterium]|nr:hypothetical protein [Verrucomicrobiae bacterium]
MNPNANRGNASVITAGNAGLLADALGRKKLRFVGLLVYGGFIRHCLLRGEAVPPIGPALQLRDRGTGRGQYHEQRAREL